jgi:aryl-alcohol dehydrogenase-like predicted oxidoreductase
MGIRAVQGGALTDALDRDLPDGHGVVADFAKAARLRALAAELGQSTAALAHRYALSMPGVDTVVLGVKNRAELDDCVTAAETGALDAETIRRVEESFD